MTKHKIGTKFTREYNGKKVTVKVVKSGYQYNKKVYRSLSAAVKEGIGTTSPASVFFKIGSGKSAAKTATKSRKGKTAAVEQAHSPLQAVIQRMVQEEMSKLREEVHLAVQAAFQDGFRGEFEAH